MDSTLDDILTARTAKDADDVFGVFATVVDKNGETLYSKGAGRVNFDSDEVPDEDTTYWAFSWTKLLTTVAALQVVERGQIALDDEVDSLLPELKNPDILSEGADGGLILTPAADKITLRHLLTHQSGIVYDGRTPLLMKWRQSRGESALSFSGDVIKAFSTPLVFEPGESWAYGGGLDWAGVIIERLNHMKLGEYMQKNIFDPLGMRHTTFHLNARPEIKAKLMDTAMRTPEGKLVPTAPWYPADAVTDAGGIGIVTSVADHVKVLADLLKDNPTVLKRSSVDAMFTPQFSKTGPQAAGLMNMPFMHENLTGGEKTLGKLSFGIGGLVTLDETPLLPRHTLSWGAMPGMAWFVNREKGLAGAFGTQMLPPGDKNINSLIGEFLKEAMKMAKV
ncbi:Acyltransferase LovD [Colletotrichum siamense]|uniref:Acyltransferase LovD n=1 Tax=Colletotrichum siamense TaxID=690259 RepID=A0A9P5BYK3_COLSI|nr:Acyltransferase LovD [Colletotrichum siamense]KAF4851531.1 Acyltransferase LovD [Colletotrichum siamense]